MNKRYFEILGISPTSDKEKIKKAYRKKALLYHPDRNPDPKANQLFIRITEAYEKLMNPEVSAYHYTYKAPQETEEERKKRHFEERLKKAKLRYEILKKLEEIENEKYYLKITSGIQWLVFRVIVVSCFALSLLFIYEYFAPSKTSFEQILSSNKNYSFQGFFQSNVAPIKTEKNEKYWITGETVLLIDKNSFVKVERTPIFEDIKSINIWIGDRWIIGKTDFSVHGTFPLVPLFLLIPLITYFLKSKTFTYSLLFNISLYLFSFTLLMFLFFNDRWLSLIRYSLFEVI